MVSFQLVLPVRLTGAAGRHALGQLLAPGSPRGRSQRRVVGEGLAARPARDRPPRPGPPSAPPPSSPATSSQPFHSALHPVCCLPQAGWPRGRRTSGLGTAGRSVLGHRRVDLLGHWATPPARLISFARSPCRSGTSPPACCGRRDGRSPRSRRRGRAPAYAPARWPSASATSRGWRSKANSEVRASGSTGAGRAASCSQSASCGGVICFIGATASRI